MSAAPTSVGMHEPLLEVRDLTVSYRGSSGTVAAVTNLSFTVAAGETVAIVGESGSGKSTTASAITGLLPTAAKVSSGSIRLDGVELAGASDRVLRGVRGRTVGLVPQDPGVSLNPTIRVGRQIGEAVVAARGPRGRSLDADVEKLLIDVGIDDPELRARQFPHELSGGQKQRVLIAIALAGSPKLIIADEPTSALDVTVQRRILDHLESLVHAHGTSLLIITHDLAVAADRADRVLVLADGELVEQGPSAQILRLPSQDYTRTLIAAAPALSTDGRLVVRHSVAAQTAQEPADEVLRVTGLRKVFPIRGAGRERQEFVAVDNVDLVIRRGETTAIVGESGSGKTTTLRLALGLERATAGSVIFGGEEVVGRHWRSLRHLRHRIQLVQQNPFGSLDPRFTVFDSIVEPLVANRVGDRASRRRRADELIDLVQLPRTVLGRIPRELSGGQRQRVAIARALALEPELILLDEPVSALDATVQGQVLELLVDLQRRLGVSYLFVSHDLAVVAQLAHQVLVLQGGVVVEEGPADTVLRSPSHPYTRELIAAVPGRSALIPEGAKL
ncbi:MAG TPA: ABC transporter ATP-binding protein [Pseudolysinimonas sp.]|nr:ABC transporter ATP-binding protein [Pseudolysinimonas sp.]